MNPRPWQWSPRWWAVAVVIPLAVALIIVGYRVDQQRVRNTKQAAVIRAGVLAQRLDRHVLAELCKTNAIIEGLVTASANLFRYEIGILPVRGHAGPNPALRPPLVNRKLLPAYIVALQTFIGWKAELDQQTACGRIEHP